ncbi:MAG: hypothetical protein WCK77_12190 [Verrucomicrobiota bacterium]
MKRSAIPMSCSLALATLSGAVVSHWWSNREFAGILAHSPLPAAAHAPATPFSAIAALAPATPATQPVPLANPRAVASQPAPASTASTPSAAQKEFFESLLDEMKQLKKTNLALRDQMAETNRDLMQLEFRVDTQSASFRPLPVSEDLSSLDTSSLDSAIFDSPDAGPGVLPPRAIIVAKPN